MTLEQWDQRVSPRLQDLKYCGTKIGYYARHIATNASTLPCRPSWDTLAREALESAEQELRIALATVKAAQEQYDNKPTEEQLQAAE